MLPTHNVVSSQCCQDITLSVHNATNPQCRQLTMLPTDNILSLQCCQPIMLSAPNAANPQCTQPTLLPKYNAANPLSITHIAANPQCCQPIMLSANNTASPQCCQSTVLYARAQVLVEITIVIEGGFIELNDLLNFPLKLCYNDLAILLAICLPVQGIVLRSLL